MQVLLAVALLGCGGPEPEDTAVTPASPPPTPWTPFEVELVDQSAYLDRISDSATTGAAPVFPADTVAVQGDEVHLFDPFGADQLIAYDLDAVRAAAWWDGTLLLATDSGLVGWNGGLVDVALDDQVEGVTDLLPLRSGLWMDTEAGLFVLRDGQLLGVQIEGVAAQGFARGTLGLAPVIWTTVGQQVVAVNFNDSGLVAYEAFEMFGSVDDLAASTDGRVLALVEGWLVQRVGVNLWQRLDVQEPVRELRGSRGAEGIWARTDTRWLHFADQTYATDVPIDRPATEDDHGRLLTSGPDGVARYSVGRPLLLVDLPNSNVLTATPIRLVPTAPDLEPTLALKAIAAGGAEVVLPVEDYTAVLDPTLLAPGPWTLEATATYADATATANALVVMGADFVPTWPEDIQPIYQEKCTPCHEGDQGILALDRESQWAAYLLQGSRPGSAGILDRVNTGNMPPGGPPLTATQKFLVQEWRNAVLP